MLLCSTSHHGFRIGEHADDLAFGSLEKMFVDGDIAAGNHGLQQVVVTTERSDVKLAVMGCVGGGGPDRRRHKTLLRCKVSQGFITQAFSILCLPPDHRL